MYQISHNSWGFGTHDDATHAQIVRTASHPSVHSAILCADGHKGYGVPIGGVVAYRDAVSPTVVGYDIGCGNKAVRLDAHGFSVHVNISEIMNSVWRSLSFGVGRKNNTPVEHDLFNSPTWDHEAVRGLKDMAQAQLGTIGSGNHYVDIFLDENGAVWIGVHFGSRGLGHKIATWFLQKGGARDGMDVDPLVIPASSILGREYIECMQLAGQYAYAGRDWVCQRVADIIGANIVEEVHNHHNFAWRERHFDEDLWVVRKGATPAFPGQRSFVGGSMGDMSVILEGLDTEEAADALHSTVHGSGRVMSRTAARGKIDRKTGEQKSQGLVTTDMMERWLSNAGVVLRGGGLDESPHCYRRLPDVLKEHAGTIRVLHSLMPIGVAMAGPNEFDPYKD